VSSAANGADAIALAEKLAGDLKLVLLDDDMPVMTGRSALPIIRARFPALNIVLMSGEAGECLDNEEVKKLCKPFALEELLKTVAESMA